MRNRKKKINMYSDMLDSDKEMLKRNYEFSEKLRSYALEFHRNNPNITVERA